MTSLLLWFKVVLHTQPLCDTVFHCFAEKSCPTSPIAVTGNQHRTMWLSGTWRLWTEMFILRMSDYKWKLNYGVRSIIATGLQSRYLFSFWFCYIASFLLNLSPPPPESKLVCLGLFTLGWHYADVCCGNDLAPRETAFPPGALHRGAIHQVQLELWLCEGR